MDFNGEITIDSILEMYCTILMEGFLPDQMTVYGTKEELEIIANYLETEVRIKK